MKKYKIGIFGSAADIVENVIPKAEELGEVLAKENVSLITGACSGLPYKVVSTAKKKNPDIEIIGFSPEVDLEHQKLFTPDDDIPIYKEIIYTPKTFELLEDNLACKKYRNVISTANCDAGIIISGRWGTMNEFTNLYDMGKVIGVLTGTGGIADELPRLVQKISKKSKAVVVFDDSPDKLVKKVFIELEKRQ